MLERIRTQIGTAGLIVAIVALIAALGGGAYAATGGNSGKATASAKQGKQGKQGKPGKTGPQGPAGPAGPAGAAGAKGDAGAAGAPGAAGANGKSVVVSPQAAGLQCEEGGLGVEVEGSGSKKFVCNGKEGPAGEPWTAGGTLPPSATETGTLAGGATGGSASPAFSLVSITIPIPLADAPDPIRVAPGETSKPGCPGLDADGTPQADPGKLCVYVAAESAVTFQGFFDPTEVGEFGEFLPGAATSGAAYGIETVGPGAAGLVMGVWAVTA